MYATNAASLKSNDCSTMSEAVHNGTGRKLTIGKVNDLPEDTLAGNVPGPHWKMLDVILQLGFLTATIAVQVI